MILLSHMRLESNDQLSQAFTVTQLPKHYCEYLISAEMFHISVTIILANIVVEQSVSRKAVS